LEDEHAAAGENLITRISLSSYFSFIYNGAKGRVMAVVAVKPEMLVIMFRILTTF
jgi:hypothetical protein